MKEGVIIIGAGPAGLSLAKALSVQGVPSTVVERQSEEAISKPTLDGRDIALTHLSRRIMQKLDMWSLMPPAQVGRILEARVLNGESDYFLHFHQKESGSDELGYIVSNHLIRQAAYDSIKDEELVSVQFDTEVEDVFTSRDRADVVLKNGQTLSASLVAAADSRFSVTRRKAGIAADMHDFGKAVIVCRMQVEQDHQGVAYECFHYGRTLAVLPLPGNLVSVVITAKTDNAQQLVELQTGEFNAQVSQSFKHRLGGMSLVTERFSYPLVAVLAKQFVSQRFALVGDAAVGMHPVTAHGFNLGLQSADSLATGVKRALSIGQDIGSDFLLKRYQFRHRRASLPMYHGTNGLVNLFNSDSFKARLARDAVLRIGNNLPPLKRLIMNRLTEARESGLSLPFLK